MTPEEFTRWQIEQMNKKKRRTMIIVASIFIVPFLFIILGVASDAAGPSDEENYKSGIDLLEQKRYLEASAKFSAIPPIFDKYGEARELMRTSDSLYNVEREAQREIEKQKKRVELKTSLSNEIKSDIFKKGFGPNYRGDIKSLQMELIVFGAWKVMIDNARTYDDDAEIKELISVLRKKVGAIQKKEFPILRREYAKVAGDVLWEDNIEVRVKGSRNAVLEFTGGSFAANRNIKATQDVLNEQLKMFRFKRTEYKWMEYDDEYTYYTLQTPDDDALFVP